MGHGAWGMGHGAWGMEKTYPCIHVCRVVSWVIGDFNWMPWLKIVK
jgi:hypothetical protein